VHLAPKEFEVLKAFDCTARGNRCRTGGCCSHLGAAVREETENLRVVINQLRKKIEKDPHSPDLF